MFKIVIPTDFSENALHAAKYTLELFKYFTCDVFIVHAFADTVDDSKASELRPEYEEFIKETEKSTNTSLKKFKSILVNHFNNPKHQVFTNSVFGSLVAVVNDCVDIENIDLVAMGTRGASKHKNITFGSNTLQVMKYVQCPVLAVPDGYNEYVPKNILFPSNYMMPYKMRDLKLLSTMAARVAATVTSLYVSNFKELSNRQQDNKAFLEFHFKNNKANFIKEAGNDVTETINQIIKSQNINMLVMVNSRQSYLENLLYTSSIDTIGLSIKIPFLVLQNLQRT